MSFSRLGLWDKFWNGRNPKKERTTQQSNNVTMSMSRDIFQKNNISSIEDWGCGNCVFKEYLSDSIEYLGIDGSNTGYQDKIEDLTEYTSSVEGVYIRHLLEHNHGYKNILENALRSFGKVLILVLFTPFTAEKNIKILGTCELRGYTIPDIAFNKEHIIDIIERNGCSYELIENVRSKTSYGAENLFIIKH